jgi:hypothetical protein
MLVPDINKSNAEENVLCSGVVLMKREEDERCDAKSAINR